MVGVAEGVGDLAQHAVRLARGQDAGDEACSTRLQPVDGAMRDDQEQPEQRGEQHEQQHQPPRHLGGELQRCAHHDARQKVRRRPEQGGQDVGREEPAARHPHHAGDQRDHGAHRSEEAPEGDALAAVALEEGLALRQHLRVPREGPDVPHPVLEVMPQPEAQSVAGDGTGHRPGEDRPEVEGVSGDQRARHEHHGDAGYQQPDDRHRLREADEEDRGARPVRVLGNPVEQRLQPVAHARAGAGLRPRRRTPLRRPSGSSRDPRPCGPRTRSRPRTPRARGTRRA